MSEPQQPPVPPYAQPSPQPQAAPQPPTAQPYPPQQPPAPQQFPPEQQYPAAPQQLPGYPGGYAPYAPTRPTASGAALGRIALIVALVTFGLGLLGTFLYPLLYSTMSLSSGFGYALVNGVVSFIVVVGSAVALVLGLAAIRRPGSPVLAGIAIGIAASELAGTAISWISSLFYNFV